MGAGQSGLVSPEQYILPEYDPKYPDNPYLEFNVSSTMCS